jgi:peptidoglycan/xylan/chitin deacetylase (PgdA/CDA1 family)
MNEYLKRFESNKFVILLFHGVIEKHIHPVRNYNRKHIEASYFEKIIKEFSDFGNAISMDELVTLKENNSTIKDNTFLVTFDDGFLNNLEIAAPILTKYSVPATFYVTTDFIDNNSMSWIDRIEFVIEKTNKKTILLPWRTEIFSIENEANKIRLLDEIRRFIKSNSTFNKEEFITQIYAQLEEEEIYSSEDILDKKMNWNELKMLSDNPLFIIGGHTHTHPILSFLDSKKLDDEIAICLNMLKKKGGIKTVHFSYPEGQSIHYNKDVIVKLKERGIVCCPSAIDGTNYMSDNLFHLKRITIV